MKQRFTMPTGELVEREFPQFKTPWNHDTNFESDRTALYCADESLTKQEFKEDADINVILARYKQTGQPPPMPVPEDFADITNRPTYLDMQKRIANANEAFYLLPPGLRAQHQNSPALWADQILQALEDGDGDQLVKLGLEIRPRKPQPAEPGTPPVVGTPVPPTSAKPAEAPKGAPKTEHPDK